MKTGCPGATECGLARLAHDSRFGKYSCIDWETGGCKVSNGASFDELFDRAHREVWKRIRKHWLRNKGASK